MTIKSAEKAETIPSVDPLRLDLQLCFALYSASNLFTRLYGPLLARLGLTYPQYVAMMVLWEASPQTVGALCRRLMLDSGTLSPLFRRLEAMELVSRQRDPKDERRVLISLTAKGRALREQAAEIPPQMRRLLPIPIEDARALKLALTAFNERLAEALRNDA